jgi:hypothetical protein
MPPATGTAVYTRRPEAVGVAAAVIEAVDSSIKTPGYGWRTQQCRNMGVPPTSLKAKKLGKLPCNWLQVFRRANTAHLGHSGGQEQ